ncbi:MAG: hypothetical protein IKN89_12815 [Oscillospiraceae bacterium]|nr:hypothetical protein [Oscillospiraceae bacterium]
MADKLTPKENRLRMLRGEIPEYVPSYFDGAVSPLQDEMLTPASAPGGSFTTVYGVEYVGSEANGWGAMPAPGKILLPDIRKWRDVIHNPDTTGRDWEGYYKKQTEKIDRSKCLVTFAGGDYFLTLVAFMGFEGALLAMYEEPEEVHALLDYVSGYYLEVMKQQIRCVHPDVFGLMDDDSGYRSPFFSLEMYREFFKPLHKKHCDLALENGMFIDRHDCGHSEQFIEDWLELGVCAWNPVQTTNDCRGIKEKYCGRLAITGCWDNQGVFNNPKIDIGFLKDAMAEYTDTFVPGGSFVWSAIVTGSFTDPDIQERSKVIRAFYDDYVHDYYKTH